MDLLSLAEITLILVPFTDVARIDLNHNRKDHDLPVRMLLIGLPLTVVAGSNSPGDQCSIANPQDLC